jgi:HEPN domain-containing protein
VPQRYPPDDPKEWLNRARSDLELARAWKPDIYLEDLCFHTQQAVEKAIKALMIRNNVVFPYVHDIATLLTILDQRGIAVPESIREAERLTRFAVLARYPSIAPPVDEEEYSEALRIAETVIHWVEEQLGTDR